jgi:hypothetical protein
MAGAYLCRNVRPLGEAGLMARRLVAPGLAVAAVIAALGGADGFASLVLLAAIVAGAARLLETVGSAAEERSDRFPVVTAAAGLAFLVAAGTAHIALLGLGLCVCVCVELLGEVEFRRPDLAADPTELPDAPVSRAA